MSDTYYRNALTSDLAAIEAFEESHNPGDAFCAEEIEEMLSSTENSFANYSALVACDGSGGIIGYIIYLELTKLPGKRSILRCFVAPEARRGGVGSELISRVCPTKTGDRIIIEVGDEDYASAAFLRKNSFVVKEVVDAEYNEEGFLEMEGFMIMANEKRTPMELSQRIKWRVV